MQNFSFLACLEVAEKFVVGGGWVVVVVVVCKPILVFSLPKPSWTIVNDFIDYYLKACKAHQNNLNIGGGTIGLMGGDLGFSWWGGQASMGGDKGPMGGEVPPHPPHTWKPWGVHRVPAFRRGSAGIGHLGCLWQLPLGEGPKKKKLRKFGHMPKLGLPYLPSSLVWTKKSLDMYSYCLPYLPIQKVWTFLYRILSLNICILTFVRILLVNNHVRYHQGPL